MSILLSDYENSLVGRYPEISGAYFASCDPGGANQKTAITLIKFAIENVLGWNDDEAIKRLDRYILRKMKLSGALEFIDFPPEVRKGDPKYLLSILYPDKVHLNTNQLVDEVYKRVIEGNDKIQFPRGYFTGIEGFYRFCACFRYFCMHFFPFDSVQDIYEFYLSPQGKVILDEYRLLVPARQFNINFLDVIHECSKGLPHAEMFYCFYKFMEKM